MGSIIKAVWNNIIILMKLWMNLKLFEGNFMIFELKWKEMRLNDK